MWKLLIVLIIVGCLILGPLSLIWALNNLFSLGIVYNLKNFLSALIIISMFAVNINAK